MTLDQAIDQAGGQAAFGRALDPPVTGQAINKWAKRGWVPPARAAEIEKLYGVPRLSIISPKLRPLMGEG